MVNTVTQVLTESVAENGRADGGDVDVGARTVAEARTGPSHPIAITLETSEETQINEESTDVVSENIQ